MKQILIGLISLVLLAVSAVSANDKTNNDMSVAEVAQLKVDTAQADAEAALIRGDTRLLAVYGLTIEVPGASEAVSSLRQRYGLRMLEGTGDAIKGPHGRLINENARNYAVKYNQLIISRVSGRN
jgi:hypothetical protein